MRAILFASVSLQRNPYITLLQRAIQPYCGEPVDVLPRLTVGWGRAHGKAGQVAHVHWIENQISPRSWFGQHAVGWRSLLNKLGNNRVVHPMRAAGELVNLASALAVAQRRGVRIVYTVHNLTTRHRRAGYYAAVEEMANRLILRWAGAVHVHSRFVGEAIAQSYGRERNVFVVPHGNYVDWYANTSSRAEARSQLSLSNDNFVYLFLGQIAPYKGLENLITAFITQADPSAWLVIAGQVVRAEYGAQVAALAQHPRMIYRPGFVPDDRVQIYLNAADVVVLPYQRITTSGSALLAFSFGRPIIAPALGGLPEVTPPSVGLLYQPGEASALLAALRQARNVSWSSQAILAHARQYDWSSVGAQMAQVYQTALCGGSAMISSQRTHA
jgi:glycosyltransferase involved in cell wall biosynthesis